MCFFSVNCIKTIKNNGYLKILKFFEDLVQKIAICFYCLASILNLDKFIGDKYD